MILDSHFVEWLPCRLDKSQTGVFCKWKF